MDNLDEKAIVKINADGTPAKCAKGLAGGECGYKAGAKVCGKCGAMAVEIKKPMMSEDEMSEDNMMGDETETVDPMIADRARRMAARKRRMATMNVKSAEWDDDAYVCGFEMKMLAGSAQPCAACPGGCAPESDLPTLLEVQGLAETMLDGKVLESGYADAADVFLVDVQRKDGKVAEVVYDGSSGECLGWTLLDDSMIGEKSAFEGMEIITPDLASELAVKTIAGDVITIDADTFDGYDAYAVEIDGINGKSYDVFVSLDGEILGYDEYDADEAKSIDAETAEYELKAMYGEEERTQMADEGLALEDGSFPIKTVADLRNAVQAFGRAKDKEKAKAHIMKRATALSKEGLIPEAWLKDFEKQMDETSVEEKAADDEFIVSMMEFELLTTEEDIKDLD